MKTVFKYLAGGVAALICVAFLAGCSGERLQAFGDLVPLQRQLAAEYGVSNIAFDVTFQDGNALGVTFVSASFSGLTGAERAELAREIASFVCETYGSMGNVDTLWIAFKVDQEHLLADASGSVSYTFDKSDLTCGGTTADGPISSQQRGGLSGEE